jgi:hypothetical protein
VHTYWGVQTCGLRGQLAGWVNYPYEFGAAVVDHFAVPECLPYVGHDMETALFVYGNGTYLGA